MPRPDTKRERPGVMVEEAAEASSPAPPVVFGPVLRTKGSPGPRWLAYV